MKKILIVKFLFTIKIRKILRIIAKRKIKNKNTKTGESETPVFYVFIKLFMKLEKYKGPKSALKRTKKLAKGKGLHDMMV